MDDTRVFRPRTKLVDAESVYVEMEIKVKILGGVNNKGGKRGKESEEGGVTKRNGTAVDGLLESVAAVFQVPAEPS